jgi:hypothetical protein
MIDHARSAHEADLMQHAKERRVNHYSARKIIGIILIRGNNPNGRMITIRIIITAMGVAESNVAGARTARRNSSLGTRTATVWSPGRSSPTSRDFHRETQDQSHCRGASSHPSHLKPPPKRKFAQHAQVHFLRRLSRGFHNMTTSGMLRRDWPSRSGKRRCTRRKTPHSPGQCKVGLESSSLRPWTTWKRRRSRASRR